MKKATPPCPHCGKAGQGLYRKQQVHGWIDLYYFDDRMNESSNDKLVYGRFGPIRCLYCDHIRTDVVIVTEDNAERVVPA